jgi:hypothetical protein
MRRQASARRHTHRPKALVKCFQCRNDARNAAVGMHGHAANEIKIADSSHRTSEYSTCAIDGYNRSRTSEGRSLSLTSIGRTYHRDDYRVQSLVRRSASTAANNSASDRTDDTNTGSGDRSASPPMSAGVRVVVLVLSRKCQSDRAIRAMPEYAAAIGIHAWLLFPNLRRQH